MAARTTLTKTTLVGPYFASIAINALDLVLTAADVDNKNQFAPSGDDLVIFQNSGAGAHTVTITSAVDPQNRTSDVTAFSIGAGETGAFRVKNLGWVQVDGKVYLEANHAEVKFAVLAL
jgi:hypothetical protein